MVDPCVVAYDSGRISLRQPAIWLPCSGEHCYNRGSMATRSGRAYLLAPLIYLAVIAGLLFLQFSSGERFARTVGAMSVSGSRFTPSEGDGVGIRSVRLAFRGLVLEFSEDAGLVVETSTELIELPPVDIAYGEDEVVVYFGNDVELVAQDLSHEYGELHLRFDIGSHAGPASRVSVPFQLNSDTTVLGDDPGSIVSVQAGDQTYFFTAPGQSVIDPTNRKIVLAGTNAEQTIRYVQASTDGRSVVNTYFRDGDLWIGAGDMETIIDEFVAAAYEGWSNGRYASSSGTWRTPDGTSAFSEKTLVAYLAEAWSRDEYERAFAEMRRAADLHPDELGLLSAVYVGSLDRARTQFIAADADLAERVRDLLQAGDARLFETPDLFQFAAGHVGLDLYEALLEFAATVPLASVEVRTAVSMVREYALSPTPEERAGEATARFAQLIDDRILPALVHADGGFFVQTSPGQVDVMTSLIAGKALEADGIARNDEQRTMIGRNLIRSAIEREGDYGLLPATLHVRGGSVEREEGWIDPAAVYPLLVENPNYPQVVTLLEFGVPGAFVTAAVPVTAVEITEQTWRFRLTYPRLRTHYVIVHGAPAVRQMELFGQQWRDAPDFEAYSKGRHYVASSQTLLVKYYDDSTQRDMVLYF